MNNDLTPANACSCKNCQSACAHKPGWFHPSQIEPLAARLNISVEQLFRDHLLVDYWLGDKMTDFKDVFVLSPRLANKPGGEMYPTDPRGVCHWFFDGKCQIHTLGKPKECAIEHHSISYEDHSERRKEIVRAWQCKQKMVRDLLGHEPAPSQRFSDLRDTLAVIFGR